MSTEAVTQISESGLTDKQERFAHEYLIDQNASAAALRAGYSARSHRARASQLLAGAHARADESRCCFTRRHHPVTAPAWHHTAGSHGEPAQQVPGYAFPLGD